MPKKTIVTTKITTTVHDDGTVTSKSDTITSIEDDVSCEIAVADPPEEVDAAAAAADEPEVIIQWCCH